MLEKKEYCTLNYSDISKKMQKPFKNWELSRHGIIIPMIKTFKYFK